MFDFHAEAVARVAHEAAAQGDHRKAAAFFRSILKHHPHSDAANRALDYLLDNGGDGFALSEQDAARAIFSAKTEAAPRLG